MVTVKRQQDVLVQTGLLQKRDRMQILLNAIPLLHQLLHVIGLFQLPIDLQLQLLKEGMFLPRRQVSQGRQV